MSGRVDYRMQRRALLRDVADGLRSTADVCDAHPDLVRAATHIGSQARGGCPVCDGEGLRNVTYVFPRYGKTARRGQAIPRERVGDVAKRLGDLAVYTVEVCLDCHWHHLVEKVDVQPAARRAAAGSARQEQPQEHGTEPEHRPQLRAVRVPAEEPQDGTQRHQ